MTGTSASAHAGERLLGATSGRSESAPSGLGMDRGAMLCFPRASGARFSLGQQGLGEEAGGHRAPSQPQERLWVFSGEDSLHLSLDVPD